MVLKDGQTLLAERRGSHGAGEYAFPGGHLELGESFKACAIRETREEAGIEIKNVKFLRLANVKKYPGKHYVDVGLTADWKKGEPQNLEPHKFGPWAWYDLDKLPQPLFEFCRLSLESIKTGQIYFDA